MQNRKKQIEEIAKNMHKIKRKLINEFHSSATQKSLTNSQFMVLQLVKDKENIGIKEIAEILNITSSATTQLIDNLVKNGYLTRRINTKDRRNVKIRISTTSKKHLSHIKRVGFKNLYTLFDVLTDRELSKYCDLNNKIAQKLINTKTRKPLQKSKKYSTIK